jgi:hypothetical protein
MSNSNSNANIPSAPSPSIADLATTHPEIAATLQVVWEQLNGLVYDIENYNDLQHMGETIIDCRDRLDRIGVGA